MKSLLRTGAGAFLAITAVISGTVPLGAAEPDEGGAQYTIRSWTELDGLPFTNVYGITQDAEGYLWIGTDRGPVRFDGRRFVRWSPRDPTKRRNEFVSELHTSRDGSVWIGYAEGGVTRVFRDGHVDEFRPEPHGLFNNFVSVFLEDSEGTLWAGGYGGLARFDGRRWRRFGVAEGLPERTVSSLLRDTSGTLWVGTKQGPFRQTRSGTFEPVPAVKYTVDSMIEDAERAIWTTHPTQTAAKATGFEGHAGPHRLSLSGVGYRFLRDSRDNVWIGTQGRGLLRGRYGTAFRDGVFERFTRANGLTSDVVLSLFEDHEGNIWVGTRIGINRLVPNAIVDMTSALGLTSEITRGAISTRDGSIWIGTADGLYRFAAGRRTRYDKTKGLPGNVVNALYYDARAGSLWVSTDGGFARLINDRWVPVLLPVDPRRLTAMTTDRDGRLWLCDTDMGILRSTDDRLTAFETVISKPSRAVYADRQGRVWVALANGAVAVYRSTGSRVFSAGDGVPSGSISTIYEDGQGTIWIGSANGVSYFESEVFVPLRLKSTVRGIAGIAITSDDDGNLWFGDTGIMRIDRSEIQRTLSDRTYQPEYTLYDSSDGLTSPVQIAFPNVARATDGRLWFLTFDGLVVVDPRHPPNAAGSPRVRVETVAADDREFEPTLTPMRLPNSARLRFEYTAPMMAGAAKVRFRYRLDGFDADWIDAGARRQAFYTNLSPGSYRFRVAAHVNGLWTDSDEVVDVSIAPRFYQTYWFLFGCTVAVVLITGILLQLRLRNARKRFALVLAERVRIARELHDTLLQGLIGVGLQCKVIADKVKSEPDSAISRLEWMQGTVERYIRDARESIRGLRSSILKEDDLPTVLRRFGESVVAGTPARFEVVVTGKPRVFPADVTEQLVRVAQEALTNAVRHGDPRCVHLEIEYQRDAVEIHVHDDGCGFDPADPAVAPHDHWGLASMHERAVQIQGKLTVTSRRGQGTAVDLVVALPE